MIFCETQVFQKRFSGTVDFNRNWADYTQGFGVLAGGEFWWGLESLQSITAQGIWQLRVFNGISVYMSGTCDGDLRRNEWASSRQGFPGRWR